MQKSGAGVCANRGAGCGNLTLLSDDHLGYSRQVSDENSGSHYCYFIDATGTYPLTRLVNAHPGIISLCLSFLLMIGFSLVAHGFNCFIPKACLYAAVGFSIIIAGLKPLAQFNRRRFLKATSPLRKHAAEALRDQHENAELDAEIFALAVSRSENQAVFNTQEPMS